MTMVLATEAVPDPVYLYWGFILVGVALVLLFVELLVPSGGLIGMLCGVAAIGSVVAFFKYDTLWGVISVLLYLILGPFILWFSFKLWLNSPLGQRMILGASITEEQDEAHRSESDQARRERLAQLQGLIGVRGETVTALRPVGVVRINGERVDALAEQGVIEANVTVVVTDVYDNQVKVRPV